MLMAFGYVLPRSIVLPNAIGFVIFFFQGLYNLAVIVMLNNTIEYDELRFGERRDSKTGPWGKLPPALSLRIIYKKTSIAPWANRASPLKT